MCPVISLIFTFMLWLYLQIRLKELLRILSGIGIFRSVILCFFLGCSIVFLSKMREEWVVPVFFVLCLGSYHSFRKDNYFLQCNAPDFKKLFLKEYAILSCPFILLELQNRNWLYASAMFLFFQLLPYSKRISFHIRPVRLFFLHKGNLEYISMIRRYGAIYLLLILFSVLGLLHDNSRIMKVCMLIWGVVQTNAYYDEPSVYTILNYKGYKTLQTVMWKSNAWNVTVLSIPLALLFFVWIYNMKEIMFLISCVFANILYLQCTGLMSYICENRLIYAILRIGIFFLLFICSCFIPLFNILFIILILISSYMLYLSLIHI